MTDEIATARRVAALAADVADVSGATDESTAAIHGGDAHTLEPLDWQTMLRDGVPPIEYLSDPYLIRGARTWIWGATGTVKSLWCLWLGSLLSHSGLHVSYFSEENPLTEDLRRLAKLQPDPGHFRMFQRTGMDLADAAWAATMLATTKGEDVVFFDSWTDLWSGDEKENRDIQRFDAAVLKTLQGQGTTPVVIHHTGHRQPFSDRGGATAGRGASALGQKADVVLEFKDAGDGRFTITYGKCRLGGIKQPVRCFKVVDTPDSRIDIVEATSPEEVAVEQLAEKMVEAILSASKGYLTTNELRAAVGGKSERQRTAFDYLGGDSRVGWQMEKVAAADGKAYSAKVWRPAGNHLMGRLEFGDEDGDVR